MTRLILERVEARPVLVPLSRPVVSRVGVFEQWPLILIDLSPPKAWSGAAIWRLI